MSLLSELCDLTTTKEKEWEELDHPNSGVGIERWFRHKETNEEYYCCDDQGYITLSKLE